MNALVVVLATLALTNPIQAAPPQLEARPFKLERSRTDTLQLAVKSAPSTEKEIKPLVPAFPRIDQEKDTDKKMSTSTKKKLAIGGAVVVVVVVALGILALMALNQGLAIGAASSNVSGETGKITTTP